MSKNIDKAITEQNRLFLLYGEENYLLDKNTEKIVKHYLNQDEVDFNLEVIESLPKDIFELINRCNTLPFMAEYRVVILKNTGLFNYKDKAALDKLADEIAHLPESTVLVVREKEVDKRKKLYKLFQTKGCIDESEKLTEEKITAFLGKWLNRYSGQRVKVSTLRLLIQRVGTDLRVLLNECEKLANYGENEITDEIVSALVPEQMESKIFALIDALGTKNKRLAIQHYRIMLENRDSIGSILFRISDHFQCLYQFKLLQAQHQSKAEIIRFLEIKPYKGEKVSQQVKYFTKAELEAVLKALTDFEWDFKRGRVDPETGLELLLLKVGMSKKEKV